MDQIPQNAVPSNSALTHKGVHTRLLPGRAWGATPEICGFAGLSQIWELHYTMPLKDITHPSCLSTINYGHSAGAMLLSRLCIFDDYGGVGAPQKVSGT